MGLPKIILNSVQTIYNNIKQNTEYCAKKFIIILKKIPNIVQTNYNNIKQKVSSNINKSIHYLQDPSFRVFLLWVNYIQMQIL